MTATSANKAFNLPVSVKNKTIPPIALKPIILIYFFKSPVGFFNMPRKAK